MTTQTSSQAGTEYPYLLPQPDSETQGFWDALKRHELALQQCQDCKTFQHPPNRTCRFCLGENMGWTKVSGRGTLYTYVIVTQGILRPWRGHDPYNVIQVLPAEVDPKSVSVHNNVTYNVIYGNAIDVSNDGLKVGMPVEAVFDDVTEDVTVLRWRPAR